MNVAGYSNDSRFNESKQDDYKDVIREFSRLLKDGGKLFITVPYGRYENHGWLQQFDHKMIEIVIDVFGGSTCNVTYYKYFGDGWQIAQGWNFGPFDQDAKPVEWVVQRLCEKWDRFAGYEIEKGNQPHEANYLKLNCSKAMTELGWAPKWDLETAIDKVIEWTKAYQDGKNVKDVCYEQIEEYTLFAENGSSSHGPS